MLYGHDRNAEEYIAACARKPKVETVQKAAPAQPGDTEGDQPPLARAVARGLKEDCRRLTRELLESGTEEIEIVNTLLIPALDRVVRRMSGATLLPQRLINAATAATSLELSNSIAKKGPRGVSRARSRGHGDGGISRHRQEHRQEILENSGLHRGGSGPGRAAGGGVPPPWSRMSGSSASRREDNHSGQHGRPSAPSGQAAISALSGGRGC